MKEDIIPLSPPSADVLSHSFPVSPYLAVFGLCPLCNMICIFFSVSLEIGAHDCTVFVFSFLFLSTRLISLLAMLISLRGSTQEATFL